MKGICSIIDSMLSSPIVSVAFIFAPMLLLKTFYAQFGLFQVAETVS